MANKPLKSIKFPGLNDTYTVPEVDATLATTGAAADAKKVGDEINDLKADLNKVRSESEYPELRNGSAGNWGNSNAICTKYVLPIDSIYGSITVEFIGDKTKANAYAMCYMLCKNATDGQTTTDVFVDTTVTKKNIDVQSDSTKWVSEPKLTLDSSKLKGYDHVSFYMFRFLDETYIPLRIANDQYSLKVTYESVDESSFTELKIETAGIKDYIGNKLVALYDGEFLSNTGHYFDINQRGVYISPNHNISVARKVKQGERIAYALRGSNSSVAVIAFCTTSDPSSLTDYVAAKDPSTTITGIYKCPDNGYVFVTNMIDFTEGYAAFIDEESDADKFLHHQIMSIINPFQKYEVTNDYWDARYESFVNTPIRASVKKFNLPFDAFIVLTNTLYSCVIYNYENTKPISLTGRVKKFYLEKNIEYLITFLADDGSNVPLTVIDNLVVSVVSSMTATDIKTLNRDAYDALLQAKRPINSGSNEYLSVPQPVVLFHFSDVHADTTELQRVVDFRDEYSNLIDDTICTGDLVQYRYSDGMAFWDNVDGSDNILIAIGNHDVLTAESGWDWTQRATQAEQYARYIEPYISKWDVSYTDGKTYYYKDYTSKSVRLIVLNCMLENDDNNTQLEWFISTLTSARTANLAVCVATHYMLHSPEKVATNFTSLDRSLGSDFLNNDYMSAVNDFVSAGGEFICYIAGHTHSDIVVKSTIYPNQYCVVIDALNRVQSNQYSDTQRTDETKSQDLANLFVIDTASKVVKLIRVGANIDHYLRSKKQMTFKYLTGDIIAKE